MFSSAIPQLRAVRIEIAIIQLAGCSRTRRGLVPFCVSRHDAYIHSKLGKFRRAKDADVTGSNLPWFATGCNTSFWIAQYGATCGKLSSLLLESTSTQPILPRYRCETGCWIQLVEVIRRRVAIDVNKKLPSWTHPCVSHFFSTYYKYVGLDNESSSDSINLFIL